MEALVDTGSPASIVSLSFIMKRLANQRTPEQSPTIWRAAVKQRLEPPTLLSLMIYGGEELSFVCQLKAQVTCGDYSTEAVSQIQIDAPLDFLLGTDLQSELGFHLVGMYSEEEGTDILKKEAYNVTRTPNPSPTLWKLRGALRSLAEVSSEASLNSAPNVRRSQLRSLAKVSSKASPNSAPNVRQSQL